MASASRFLLSRLPAAAASSSRLLRPLAAAGSLLPAALAPSVPRAAAAARCFATLPATSSMRDSSPNWSRGPPKETILLDGCDFEHWLVVMDPPPGDPSNPDPSRDEIIDDYIKTLARVVGSEEEARHKIYSVSTRHYFAFGALVSEELTYKLKELPKVRWVLPDSYLDVRNKDYGGEPFINGEAVPYDPKYHEEWVRNNARANERTRRNDRPRNFDRSRNFERRENTQNFQNRDVPPGQGFNSPPPPGQGPVPPRDAPPMHHAQDNVPLPPPPNAGAPPSYHPHAPNPQASYTNYQQGGAPGYQGSNQGYQGPPPPPHSAYQGNNPGYQGGGPGYQGDNPPPYQGGNPGYAPGYHGQGGNPSYQQGGDNYNTGAPAYERDGQGRNYQ